MFNLKKLEAARARVAGLKAERGDITNATPHVDDVHVATLARMRGVAEAAGRTLRARLLAGDVDLALSVRTKNDGTVDLTPVLLAVLGPDALTDALVRHLTPTPGALTAAQRAQRLAEIERELFTAEFDEEAQIEASEAAGTPVARRADASICAVIGERDA